MQEYPIYQERDLLHRLAAGDQDAFTVLFMQYRDKLFGFIYGITQSETRAEDVLQDVFLRIWQHRVQMATVENLNAYIFRMCKNIAINHLRSASNRQLSMALAEFPDAAAEGDPETLLHRKEAWLRLRTAVDQLPERQKEIFLLLKDKGMKQEEVAQQLQLSLSTVQNHLFRALQNVRRALGDRYVETLLCLFVSHKDFFF